MGRGVEHKRKIIADRAPHAFFSDPEIVAAIVGKPVGQRTRDALAGVGVAAEA